MTGTDAATRPRCIGFGEREGKCENLAGGAPRDNPIWCGECDVLRIEHLSSQFELLGSRFRLDVDKSKGEVEVWVSDDQA